MVIRINGKEESIDKPVSLAALIQGKGFVPGHVVVEHNSRITQIAEWSDIILCENDNIEIISFMGGG